jgi:hypothetical protein
VVDTVSDGSFEYLGATASVEFGDSHQQRHQARNRLSVRILFITSNAATL